MEENKLNNAIANSETLLQKIENGCIEKLDTRYKVEYAKYLLENDIRYFKGYLVEKKLFKDECEVIDFFYDDILKKTLIYQTEEDTLIEIMESIPEYKILLIYEQNRKKMFKFFEKQYEKISYISESLKDAQDERKKELDKLHDLLILCKIDSGIELLPTERLYYYVFLKK